MNHLVHTLPLFFEHSGDSITDSMRTAIEETRRRREIQQKYNEEHGITPTTIKKAVRDLIAISKAVEEDEDSFKKEPESMDEKELKKLAGELEKKMRQAAAELNFDPREITERFVRGDLSRNTEGSGLGLAIASSFVELQGGTLDIEIDGDLFKAIVVFQQKNP